MITSLDQSPQWTKAPGRLPALVILYVIAFTLPIQANIGGLVFTTVRLLLLLVIVPLTINLLRGRYGRVLLVDIMFFLHILWGAVALTANNPDRVVAFMGSNSIEFIGGYLIARACIQNIDDFRRLIWFLVVVVVATFPLALYETLTGDPFIIRMIESMPGISSTTIANSAPRLGLRRVQVFLAHPIHYGLFASFILSSLFVGFREGLPTMTRYGLTLIVLICIFLSLSSGALLAALLQIGLVLWAWVFKKNDARWIIFFLTCIAAYVTVDLLSNRTPIQVFMHYATFNSHNAYFRSIIFDWGMKNVWANPIFGIGLNDWVRPIYMRSGSMDNFWLVMVVRYGIPGFLFLAFGYLLALWRIGRRNLHGDQPFRQLRLGWMFSMVGMTFTLTTVHIWGEIYSFVFFFFGAGIWMITAAPKHGEEILPSKEQGGYPHATQTYNGNTCKNGAYDQQVSYTRFPKHGKRAGNPP